MYLCIFCFYSGCTLPIVSTAVRSCYHCFYSSPSFVHSFPLFAFSSLVNSFFPRMMNHYCIIRKYFFSFFIFHLHNNFLLVSSFCFIHYLLIHFLALKCQRKKKYEWWMLSIYALDKERSKRNSLKNKESESGREIERERASKSEIERYRKKLINVLPKSLFTHFPEKIVYS